MVVRPSGRPRRTVLLDRRAGHPRAVRARPRRCTHGAPVRGVLPGGADARGDQRRARRVLLRAHPHPVPLLTGVRATRRRRRGASRGQPASQEVHRRAIRTFPGCRAPVAGCRLPGGIRRTAALSVLAAAVTAALLAPTPALAGDRGDAPDARGRHTLTQPTLVARATLSADYLARRARRPARWPRPANGRTGPFAGPGHPRASPACVDNRRRHVLGAAGQRLRREGQLRGLPAAALPRDARTGRRPSGGDGDDRGARFVSLRDPDHLIDFPIVNEDTADRLLTGADFDIESVVRATDGTLLDRRGVRPVPAARRRDGALLPRRCRSRTASRPHNPYLAAGETPRIARAAAASRRWPASRDGRYLYPIVEGALIDDTDQRRRWIYEFDTAAARYTGKHWAYQTDQDANLVGDAFMVGKHELLARRARRLRRPGRRDQARLPGRPRQRRRRRVRRARRSCSTR